MSKNYKCEIRPNNAAVNESCAFCGEQTDPGVPLAIFKAGTYESICDQCAEKYAPDEAGAIRAVYEQMEYIEAQKANAHCRP